MQWEDPHGRQRIWESAERTTRRSEVDGVAIVAKVRKGLVDRLGVMLTHTSLQEELCGMPTSGARLLASRTQDTSLNLPCLALCAACAPCACTAWSPPVCNQLFLDTTAVLPLLPADSAQWSATSDSGFEAVPPTRGQLLPGGTVGRAARLGARHVGARRPPPDML